VPLEELLADLRLEESSRVPSLKHAPFYARAAEAVNAASPTVEGLTGEIEITSVN
jgi:hypothetical protein